MDLIFWLFHVLLVVPMTNMLVALAQVFGGNFGIAIIVFTLLMRGATWPLTSSQYKQSKAMQALQPKMEELRKKYKGKDPKKMQAETMALYREAGVNPLGCILPMLVQFPIWIALYQVIRVSLGETPEGLVTLSQALYPIPFIHSAVPLDNQFLYWDLGVPDATYVLPLMVASSMYVQQKMVTPTPTAATRDSQAAQTQQMMLWMMPLMFGFFSLQVPAGLALYWAASNIIGIILQYFYMGRRLNLKNLFTLGPGPAPRGRAGGAGGTGGSSGGTSGSPARPKQPAESPKPLPAAELSEPSDGQAAADMNDTPVVAQASGQRRKRHARRRGKR